MATHPADTTADHRLTSREVLAYAAAYLEDDDGAFPGVEGGGRSAYVLRAAAIYQANLLSKYEDVGTEYPAGSAEHAQRWEGRGDSWQPAVAAVNPTYRTYHMANGTLGWSVLAGEVDAGRPMVFLVDTNADGITDHFVTVVGYREDSRQYACLDTWDASVHWYDFATIAPGQPWGVWGGWAFSLGGGSLAAPGMASGPPPADAQSRTGPEPPRYRPVEAQGGGTTIPVPVCIWRHGCGPTALGMVVGHWAANGYPQLAQNGVAQAIATAGHYEDYAEPLDYWPDLLADRSETGGSRPHDCLADFMRCSWSGRDNRYGWSWASDMGPAFMAYVNASG